MPLLEMRNICKSFSGIYANEDVSLSVERGEIHALLGENGAGKTTLMNILFGLYTADSGTISWKGEQVHFASPSQALSAGIGMVHQHFSLVNRMTVLDNVILNLSQNNLILSRGEARKKLIQISGDYGIDVSPDARVCDLSVGEKQRVEIIKALYRSCDLLILDEPTAVLTPQETDGLFEVLTRLKQEDHGVILITHRMSEVMSITDRITVLRNGRCVTDCSTADARPDEIAEAMVGRSAIEALQEDLPKLNVSTDGVALELNKINYRSQSGAHSLTDVSFSVASGEVFGVAGVEGNGQRELAEIISGVAHPKSGQVVLCGSDVTHMSIKARNSRGLAYISDDRLGDGLIGDFSIEENLLLRDYDKPPFSKAGVLNLREAEQNAEAKMKLYKIRASGKTACLTKTRLLSGGNQQKVVVARELEGTARLVVANQPTRGLDMGAAEFVRRCLENQASAGAGVIFISADIDELLAVSNRIAVMYGGKIAKIVPRAEATPAKLGLLMAGFKEGNDSDASEAC